MTPRSIVKTTTILVVLFSLSGCTQAPNPDMGKFKAAQCPVQLPEESGLEEIFEYGYITVPEQHDKPSGPVIQIAVARFKSLSGKPQPDPIVLNTGGPGDSNLDQFIPFMATPAGKGFLSQRDVVIIELRGLRYSKPALICDEVYEAQLDMLSRDIRSEESDQILLNAMRASYDRFLKQGINLSAFNNVETAADIDLVMTSLGYDKFNLFGSSAGTIIAQHVMRDYPERLRSVILNAAVPLGQPFFRDMMINASESLDRMFKLCESDETCHLAFPDIKERFFAHIEKLNAEPVTIPVKNPANGEEIDFVLNGDRLSAWIFSSMYFNTQIPYSLSKFMEGDYSELQTNAQIFFPMPRFSYGLSYTIFSTEQMDFEVEETKVKGRYAAFADGISLFFSPKLIAQAQDFWKVKPIDRSLLAQLNSDIPTLVLNGEMDHVLPSNYVQVMVSGLRNGYVYLFPGVAHSPVETECGFLMAVEFLNDPSKAPDITCMKQFKHIFRLPE